ncbi:hypothetical protein D9R14_07030 [Xanthobacter tagetidis]|uniref:Lipoprotein n=2 Tax=Xanthobacter tagetidis TaxID=60216 RepID=A0A3L7AK64_9HYPH|nr:hypothetical protein D9R14_07030 [Xanthobacter tagetidis]
MKAMRSGEAGYARALKAFATIGVIGAGLMLAGCQTDGLSGGGGALAFDRIEGPPPQSFDRLVTQLSSAADARRVEVVSRQQDAPYRVKGYLSAHQEGGRTSVAYVWDIYGRDRERVARVSGEETVSAAKGSDPWAACTDACLAKIAESTMAGLSEALGGPAAPAAAAIAAAAPVAPERSASLGLQGERGAALGYAAH